MVILDICYRASLSSWLFSTFVIEHLFGFSSDGSPLTIGGDDEQGKMDLRLTTGGKNPRRKMDLPDDRLRERTRKDGSPLTPGKAARGKTGAPHNVRGEQPGNFRLPQQSMYSDTVCHLLSTFYNNRINGKRSSPGVKDYSLCSPFIPITVPLCSPPFRRESIYGFPYCGSVWGGEGNKANGVLGS
jgi:hypothetical protein